MSRGPGACGGAELLEEHREGSEAGRAATTGEGRSEGPEGLDDAVLAGLSRPSMAAGGERQAANAGGLCGLCE